MAYIPSYGWLGALVRLQRPRGTMEVTFDGTQLVGRCRKRGRELTCRSLFARFVSSALLRHSAHTRAPCHDRRPFPRRPSTGTPWPPLEARGSDAAGPASGAWRVQGGPSAHIDADGTPSTTTRTTPPAWTTPPTPVGPATQTPSANTGGPRCWWPTPDPAEPAPQAPVYPADGNLRVSLSARPRWSDGGKAKTDMQRYVDAE